MNETQIILSRRYATAFFMVNKNALTLDDASACERAAALLHVQSAWLAFFDVPRIQVAQQDAMIDLLIARLAVSSSMRPLLVVLCAHKRMNLLPSIFDSLNVQICAHHNVLSFMIKSFPVLQKSELDVLCSFLHQKTGKKIIVHCAVDKELIAGIRAESNGLLWEYSIAKRLRDAQHACVSGDDQ